MAVSAKEPPPAVRRTGSGGSLALIAPAPVADAANGVLGRGVGASRESADLLLRRQLVAVRGECFTKGVAWTAAGRILVTRTAGLAGCLGVGGQRLRRFGSRDRQRAANCQRCYDGSQDFKIHL